MREMVIFFLIFSVSAFAAETPAPILGCWQLADQPDQMMRFEEKRMVSITKRGLNICPASYDKGKLKLSSRAGDVDAEFTIEGDTLTLNTGGQTQSYKRMKDVPPELDLSPLKLPARKPIPEEKVNAIKEELRKRLVEDQAVRTNPDRHGEMHKVDAENTAWLREQVLEHGWLDAERFGKQSASTAFLIVQHSGDLRLMQAALPEIEKDMKSGAGDPQDFALLYDRTKIYLGEKQRYGSQLGQNAEGDSVLLPLEDSEKVEQFRKEIGLFPLSQYLEIFEKQMGKPVKVE
ncbi:MAG TPA: DUF6624 domain-containing protein [Planctomycetota bacterium]|nr:DUF6624 domain-containing protein [Planctomycetota bacterium]